MSVSIYLSSSIQGNAYVINSIGSIRMKVYALLSGTLSFDEIAQAINSIESILNDTSFINTTKKHSLNQEYIQLNSLWDSKLKRILSNLKPGDVATPLSINRSREFISLLQKIIKSIENKTESKIVVINGLQKASSFIVILFSFIAMYSLNKRFFRPWSKLLIMAKNIQRGDFSSKFDSASHDYRDEMWQLGNALNNMSEGVKHTYDNLEQMVAEKTHKLNLQNLHLEFLYRSCKLFQNQEFNCKVLAPFMRELIGYTGASKIKIYIYDPHRNEVKGLYTFGENVRPTHCSSLHCSLCISSIDTNLSVDGEYKFRLWNVGDAHNDYGYIAFLFSKEVTISHDTEQLIFAFCNLLSQSLSLHYKERQQQQLLLFKERNTIAQTLHDSIAQSLSYLKIKVSLLQRDTTITNSSQVENIVEMRSELNEAYSNIRKLISTFRTPYKKVETLILLRDAIVLFNDTYGFNIRLEYKEFHEDYSYEQEVFILNFFNELFHYLRVNMSPSRIELHIRALAEHVIVILKGESEFECAIAGLAAFLTEKSTSFTNERTQVKIDLHVV
jgi:two-component system nitrate/nitrite sensor histidine kinase NarX